MRRAASRPTPASSLAVPLEGPPTLECGAFAVVPDGQVAADSTWETAEEGRPVRPGAWWAPSTVDGDRCVKLEGVQKSDDWDKPRGRPHRLAPHRHGLAGAAPRRRLARGARRRAPRAGPRDPTYKSVLRYELEESMQYPGRLYEERRREIVQAHAFADAAAPLLATPAKYGPQLTALLNRIAYHLDHQPQTPYREAVLQVKRRVEAAQRGETPPAPATVDPPDAPPVVAAVGARGARLPRPRPRRLQPRSASARPSASRCCSSSTTRPRRPPPTSSPTPSG